MTLKQVVTELQKIALTQRNVRSTGYGDISLFMSNPSVKWDVFYVTTADNSTSVEGLDRYTLTCFYISRIQDLESSNQLQVHSVGKEVLDNIARIFCEKYDCDIYGTTYYTFFNQRFEDLAAGCYMQITFEIPASTCIDE